MKTIFYSLLVIKFQNATLSLSDSLERGRQYDAQILFLNFNLKKYLDLHISHVSIIYFVHKPKVTYQGDVKQIANFEIILLLNISIKYSKRNNFCKHFWWICRIWGRLTKLTPTKLIFFDDCKIYLQNVLKQKEKKF